MFLAVLSACAGGFAQDIISAKVDKTVAEVNDEILLTVTVSGISADVLSPQMPSLPNFNIYEAGYSASSDFDGKVYTVSTQYLYRLIPRFAGRAEIGPIKIKYLDKEYYTQPVYIDVYRKGESSGKPSPQQTQAATSAVPAQTAQSAAPSARPVVPQPSPAKPVEETELYPNQKYADAFLQAFVDKHEAYVGEQITLTMSFYSAIKVTDFTPLIQSFQGLAKEDIDTENKRIILGGKDYFSATARTALFGLREGTAKIDSSHVDYLYMKPQNSILGSWQITTNTVQKDTAKSVPIDIKIKPLPAGAGPSFYGAVGDKFSINADVDNKTAEAGTAVTLTLTVRGVGNLKMITQPAVPEIKGMKMYEVAGTTNSAAVNGVVQGYKTFKTVLVPASPGNYTVPSIPFTYFSPALGKYQTIKTEPIDIKVTPSTSSAANNVFSYGTGGGGPSAQNVAGDIHYIKQNAGKAPFNFAVFAAGFGLLNLIPVLVVLAALFIKFLEAKGLLDRAVSKAKKKAKAAKNAQELDDALFEFIERKTGTPTGSLKINEITEMLVNKHKVNRATVTDLEALSDRLDAFRFAPQGFVNALEAAKLKQTVLRIIRALEREIK